MKSLMSTEQYYKCFRLDRTALDKEKYGKVGGSGGKILVKQSLDIIVKKVNIMTRLPILSIDVKFKDQSKICISTFYRYGYSDMADFLETEKYFTGLCRKRKDVILIGDLNLSSVEDWTCPFANNDLENICMLTFLTI